MDKTRAYFLSFILFMLIAATSFLELHQTKAFSSIALPSSDQNDLSTPAVLKQGTNPIFAQNSWAANPLFIIRRAAALSPIGLSPSQIRRAYNLPESGGHGTIAIIDAFDCPTVQSDFVVFSNQYGLPANNLEVHKMAPAIQTNGDWSLEISLDVQWAHAVAPNASILLVEATNDSDVSLLSAVSYATSRPDVVAVSMSWGGSEDPSQNLLNSYFSSPGKVFFASSGDNGSGVIWPSTSQNVIAVGGTSLSFNVDGSVASETGWSGSGGGISSYEPEPQYQLTYGLVNPGNKREVPDVSYDADPNSGVSVYDTTPYKGQMGWFKVGGTSAGAPQWAAIQSLGLSASNNNFYQDAKYNNTLFFRDITSGSNGAYSATAGFDLVTGLGSPIVWNFTPTLNITLNTPGLPNASNVVHYTQNGVNRNGGIVANTFSDLVDLGTTLSIDNPIYGSNSQRYYTTDLTAFTVQSSTTFTATFKTQWFIDVNTTHDAPTASQWVNQGSNFTVSVASPTEIAAGDHQWICTGYRIDAGSSTQGTTFTFTAVASPHSIVFDWKEQFYLTVNSAYGSPIGGWYDAGAAANAILSSGSVSGGNGVQYIFTGWSGDGSGTGLTSDNVTMNSAKTAVANWKTQYYLSVNSPYGTVGGTGWYDSGTSASATVTPSTVTGAPGTQYVFTGWSADASGTSPPSSAITMNGPKTAAASWKAQYLLNISSNFGSVNPVSGWYDANSKVNISSATTTPDSGERYVWVGWTGTGSASYTGTSSTLSIVMNSSVTETAIWTHQYTLTIISQYGSPAPASNWFDAGTPVNASVDSPVPGLFVAQYVCTGWTGTGSALANGTGTNTQFTINEPSSITWKWEMQLLPIPILMITVLVVFAGITSYFLLRKSQKRRKQSVA